jgi:hypothetical protein
MPHWQRGTGFVNRRIDPLDIVNEALHRVGQQSNFHWGAWKQANARPAQDFQGTGPMLDFRRGADGVWKLEPTPA